MLEDCWSCGDLVWVGGFNSIFDCDACIWSLEAIAERKAQIVATGFDWVVTESLPVHERIKRGQGGMGWRDLSGQRRGGGLLRRATRALQPPYRYLPQDARPLQRTRLVLCGRCVDWLCFKNRVKDVLPLSPYAPSLQVL